MGSSEIDIGSTKHAAESQGILVAGVDPAEQPAQSAEVLLAQAQPGNMGLGRRDKTARPMNEVLGEAQNVSYYDQSFDQKLASTRHNVLRLTDVPTGIQVSFWKDQNGYFFFFQNGADGKKPHYIPSNVTQLQKMQNGQLYTREVSQVRNQVDAAYAQYRPPAAPAPNPRGDRPATTTGAAQGTTPVDQPGAAPPQKGQQVIKPFEITKPKPGRDDERHPNQKASTFQTYAERAAGLAADIGWGHLSIRTYTPQLSATIATELATTQAAYTPLWRQQLALIKGEMQDLHRQMPHMDKDWLNWRTNQLQPHQAQTLMQWKGLELARYHQNSSQPHVLARHIPAPMPLVGDAAYNTTANAFTDARQAAHIEARKLLDLHKMRTAGSLVTAEAGKYILDTTLFTRSQPSLRTALADAVTPAVVLTSLPWYLKAGTIVGGHLLARATDEWEARRGLGRSRS